MGSPRPALRGSRPAPGLRRRDRTGLRSAGPGLSEASREPASFCAASGCQAAAGSTSGTLRQIAYKCRAGRRPWRRQRGRPAPDGAGTPIPSLARPGCGPWICTAPHGALPSSPCLGFPAVQCYARDARLGWAPRGVRGAPGERPAGSGSSAGGLAAGPARSRAHPPEALAWRRLCRLRGARRALARPSTPVPTQRAP